MRHNIGPISAANSRLLLLGQCRHLHRSRASAETWPTIGPIPSRFLLLLWHPVPKVEKSESGPWISTFLRHFWARCCAENKFSWQEYGPKLAAKYIPELSFQKWHDIGNRFSEKNLPMLGQCWTVSYFALG